MALIFRIPITLKESNRTNLAFVSAVVALLYYARSSAFNQLFGEWKWWKTILYAVFSFITLIVTMFTNTLQGFSFPAGYRAPTRFFVLIFAAVYSFFSDRAAAYADGKTDDKSLISYLAFAVMSFCCGFQELLCFFLEVVIIQLLKINWFWGLAGISFTYLLIEGPPRNLSTMAKRFGRVPSSIVVGIGLFCYALSSSFHHVFGEWNNPWKIVAYGVFSSTACLVILFAQELQQRLILRFGPDLILFGMSIILGYSLRYSLSDAYFLVSCAAFFMAVLILALLILHSRICYLVAVMVMSLKYSSKTQNLLLFLVLNIGLTCLYILRFVMDSYIQERYRYRYRVIEAMRQPLVEIVIGEPPSLEQPGATAQINQVASVESDASAQNMEQVSLQQVVEMENRLVAEREGQCSNVTPEQLGILSPR